MSATSPSPVLTLSSRTVREAIPALLVGLIVFGGLFYREIGAAVQVWESSTAFSHCFVVLPIAAYLAWDRRDAAASTPLQPFAWAALAALPLALAWLAAERIGVMEGRQLVAIGFVDVLFLAVLGWRLWRVFSAALLYLFFLVPFGAFLVPSLQVFTTDFITVGLTLLGIPHFADAFTIEISAGTFLVAEACAGLRFLIASFAFGVLYACLLYRSRFRRVVFIAASLVVPIIANGFRALGIVVLGNVLGSAEAAAVDHIVYGWLFFSAVLLTMIVAGLPFREDRLPRIPLASARRTGRPLHAVLAVCAVVVPMTAGPAAAFLLDRRAAAVSFATDLPILVPGPDCTPDTAVSPAHRAEKLFACQGIKLLARIEVFSPKSNPSVLLAAAREASEAADPEDTVRSTLKLADAAPHEWNLVETAHPRGLTAMSFWIDGAASSPGLRLRLQQGWNSIFGGDHAPMLVAVTATSDGERTSPALLRQTLTNFLQAQGTLADQIARLSTRSPSGG